MTARLPPVRQLRGAAEIERALDAGTELGLILALEDPTAAAPTRAADPTGAADPTSAAPTSAADAAHAADAARARVLGRAERAGVPIRLATASVLARMTSVGEPADLLALVGRRPEATLDESLARGGALWLLTGVAYPTNAGVAIRTAEGSGATAIAIDAPTWDHTGRRSALRAAMRADWYMPVFWECAEVVIDRAHAQGHAIYAVENSGTVHPWDLDLTGPAVFVIGGESEGIPAPVLTRCTETIRVPMAGFIPSYNLQIALGVVATERIRQLDRSPPTSSPRD